MTCLGFPSVQFTTSPVQHSGTTQFVSTHKGAYKNEMPVFMYSPGVKPHII